MNTDQGSQLTGSAWITTLTEAGVRISMDGRGRYLDNIFIERLWRSLKQEAVYLEEIKDGFQARQVINNWMTFYNTERPHSSLERRTPKEAYWAGREEKLAARKPTRIHLRSAAKLSKKVGPLQSNTHNPVQPRRRT
ncbi:transposase [Sulfitobacter sediminilitoris]